MPFLRPRKKFFFEKWYFDAQGDDGTFLFVYFAGMTLLGRRSGQVVVSLRRSDGSVATRSFNYPARQVDIDAGRRSVRFGEGALSVRFDTCSFRLEEGDDRVDLSWKRLDPPWVPRDDGVLLRLKRRSLSWQVPVPRAEVTGTVRLSGLDAGFDGLGYHDFVQTDIPPWRLPLRELLWGRALGRAGGAIWNRPVFVDGAEPFAVELGWVGDGSSRPRVFDSVGNDRQSFRTHPGTGGSYPSDMTIRFEREGAPDICLGLTDTELMLGDGVADVAGFSGPLERWLYRKFTGNPVEYKLTSAVESDGPLHQAFAAHELVLWGRGRRG